LLANQLLKHRDYNEVMPSNVKKNTRVQDPDSAKESSHNHSPNAIHQFESRRPDKVSHTRRANLSTFTSLYVYLYSMYTLLNALPCIDYVFLLYFLE
jgi:hypothetical protein